VNQEESKQNEVNGMKKGAFRCASPDAYLKQRFVMRMTQIVEMVERVDE